MKSIKNAIFWIGIAFLLTNGIAFLLTNGLAMGIYLMYAYWTLAEVLVNHP
jgi:hypothetical protein